MARDRARTAGASRRGWWEGVFGLVSEGRSLVASEQEGEGVARGRWGRFWVMLGGGAIYPQRRKEISVWRCSARVSAPQGRTTARSEAEEGEVSGRELRRMRLNE